MAPRRVDRRAKRRQIIEAAARVFARRGLGASTMSQIAAVAEVGKGTLYEYFPSKRSLILAVFEDLHHSLLEESRVRFTGEGARQPAAARLRGFFELLLDAGESMRELLPLWMEMWAAASTEAVTVVTSDRELRRRIEAAAEVPVTCKGCSSLFESKRSAKRRSRRGRYPASTAGLPKGANRITQEMKGIWLEDEEGP